MKQILEVTFAFEIEAELSDGQVFDRSLSDLRVWGNIPALLTLTQKTTKCPSKILFQSVSISLPYQPPPDEFRCDHCRRTFSNDQKNINEEGDELCNGCEENRRS